MKRKSPLTRSYSQRNKYVYECTRCHKMPVEGDNEQSRDLLLQKKVVFATLGSNYTVKLTRTVDWLCKDCLLHDADYMAEPYPRRRLISEIEDNEEYLRITNPSYAQGDSDADEPYRPAGY